MLSVFLLTLDAIPSSLRSKPTTKTVYHSPNYSLPRHHPWFKIDWRALSISKSNLMLRMLEHKWILDVVRSAEIESTGLRIFRATFSTAVEEKLSSGTEISEDGFCRETKAALNLWPTFLLLSEVPLPSYKFNPTLLGNYNVILITLWIICKVSKDFA